MTQTACPRTLFKTVRLPLFDTVVLRPEGALCESEQTKDVGVEKEKGPTGATSRWSTRTSAHKDACYHLSKDNSVIL